MYYEYKVEYYSYADDANEDCYGVLWAENWEELGARLESFYGKDNICSAMIWPLNENTVYEFNGPGSTLEVRDVKKII